MTSALDVDVLAHGRIHIVGQIVEGILDATAEDCRLIALEILVVFYVI